MRNFNLFLIAWVFLASIPLILSFLFDYIITHLFTINIVAFLKVLLPVFFILFFSFLSVCLWVIFDSKVSGQQKILVIIIAYLLIWWSFANLYFFTCNIDNYLSATKLLSQQISFTDSNQLFELINDKKSSMIHNIDNFWRLSNATTISFDNLIPYNRLGNYINCMYFSGISILTIGYGDFYPISAFTKMTVLLEGFLGLIINVLAIGLWLSTVSKPNS